MRPRRAARRLRVARVLPVVVLGLVACSSGSSDDAVATASPVVPASSAPSTASTTPAETSGSTMPAPDPPPWDFTFGDVDGLVAVDTPHLASVPFGDEVTTVWASSGDIVHGYLTLRDIPSGPATSPEGDVAATRIDVPTGEGWRVTDNMPDAPPPSSATRFMWWRDDGRLWIASNYGMTPDALTRLALQIEVGRDGSHTLADASMALIGSTRLATYQAMTQAWTLDGHHVSLVVTNGGLAQQLSDLPVHQLVEHTVAGHSGYALTLSNGQLNLIWPTEHPGWWASILGEPVLAERMIDLGASVVPT